MGQPDIHIVGIAGALLFDSSPVMPRSFLANIFAQMLADTRKKFGITSQQPPFDAVTPTSSQCNLPEPQSIYPLLCAIGLQKEAASHISRSFMATSKEFKTHMELNMRSAIALLQLDDNIASAKFVDAYIVSYERVLLHQRKRLAATCRMRMTPSVQQFDVQLLKPVSFIAEASRLSLLLVFAFSHNTVSD
jgi:hypothetical protein